MFWLVTSASCLVTLALLVGAQVVMTRRHGWRGLAGATASAVFLALAAAGVLSLALLHGPLGRYFAGVLLAVLLWPFIAAVVGILLAFTVKTE